MAALVVVSAWMGQIVTAPFALIPLMAGIGILRKRAWSAYGFVLFFASQLLVLALVVIRGGIPPGRSLDFITAAAMWAILIPLFLLAGRALAKSGAQRGSPLPWIAISALCSLPLIFVQPFVIPSAAMEDTLLVGDRILVQRLPGPRPVRGDMVVFVYPIDRQQTYVKRVVGVPGDRIRISGKVLYRNGTAIQEPYAVHKTDYVDRYRDNSPSEPNVPLPYPAQQMLERNVVNGEVVVPEGNYFVLGDNRDDSLDSRYWGFVSSGDLIGKPLLIYDSEEQPAEALLNGQTSGRGRIRWSRFFKLL
ncbi:MAG: signal peptidase I [Bryobacteraceae bacterium]